MSSELLRKAEKCVAISTCKECPYFSLDKRTPVCNNSGDSSKRIEECVVALSMLKKV